MIKKIKIIFILLLLISIAAFIAVRMRAKPASGEIVKEVNPVFGSIQTVISTTGTVLPKNRLEIRPPVNGRVESVLVQEGEKIKTGQILAWMSSTERAALLDAAQGQGEKELKYWQEAYKPIALLAPIDAEVIVATVQPGQTVTTSDPVVVLSDHLIARAQVDETDIGKIKSGQKAVITLDAYPDTEITAVVEHIYYESKTVNNVTIYEVDLLPEEVPLFFRSGMNTAINFIEKSSQHTLLLPLEAIHREQGKAYVLLKQDNAPLEPVKRSVELGISDDKNVEIISGINENDKIIIKAKKYSLPKSDTGTNPFMPARRGR